MRCDGSEERNHPASASRFGKQYVDPHVSLLHAHGRLRTDLTSIRSRTSAAVAAKVSPPLAGRLRISRVPHAGRLRVGSALLRRVPHAVALAAAQCAHGREVEPMRVARGQCHAPEEGEGATRPV